MFKRMTLVVFVMAVGISCQPDVPATGDGFTDTRYPIVLSHGFLGAETYAGILDYWYGIPASLEVDGAQVFVTEVSLVNSSYARGEQLLSQVQDILAVTGASKVHLIGHSQGGLDIRYVAGVRPDLVASATAVAGPHGGAPMADIAQDSELILQLGGGLVEIFGTLLGILTGTDELNDGAAALSQLSTAGVAAFNADFPEGLPATWCGEGDAVGSNGVRYYSWTGTGSFTNALDPLDYLWAITSLFAGEDNDGLVGRCSAHLGDVIRDDYFHNHLDEVNQAFGIVPQSETDPRMVFRIHANRLKNLGL